MNNVSLICVALYRSSKEFFKFSLENSLTSNDKTKYWRHWIIQH